MFKDSPIYNFPIQFLPINPIVPFTKRDGFTFIQALEWLRNWLNNELLPTINTNFQDYAQRVQTVIDELEATINISREHADRAEDAAAEAAQTIATVQALLSEVIDAADAAAMSAVAAEQARAQSEVIRDAVSTMRDAVSTMRDDVSNIAAGVTQDSVVNNIVSNTDSVTRGTLDSLYLTPDSTIVGAVDDDVKLAQLGTLYETLSDFFVTRPKDNDVAIAVGSSNNQETTFNVAGMVAAELGVRYYNFAAGGAAVGNGGFNTQLENAINSTAFNNEDVRWVFVVDMSNDVRAEIPIDWYFQDLLTKATNHFPNARIVVVPVLWPTDDRVYPQAPGWQPSWRKRVMYVDEEARRITHGYKGAVYCDYSWTWHQETTTYQVNNEVHFTPEGRKLSAKNILKCIEGEDTRLRVGWRNAVGQGNGIGNQAQGNINGLALRRDGNTITIGGAFNTIPQDIPAGTIAFTIPRPFYPNSIVKVFAHRQGNDQVVAMDVMNQNGIIRSAVTLYANQIYYMNATYDWSL